MANVFMHYFISEDLGPIIASLMLFILLGACFGCHLESILTTCHAIPTVNPYVRLNCLAASTERFLRFSPTVPRSEIRPAL